MSVLTPSLESIRGLHFEVLEDVLHRSVKQLFLKNMIPPNYLDRRPYPQTLDGGIEICFSIPDDQPLPSPFFKTRNVIIQSKATDKKLSAAAFQEEIDKIELQTFFEAYDNVQYIIAYSKVKFPEGKNSEKFKSHLKEFQTRFKLIYPHLVKKITIDIWLTDDIKNLVDTSPSSWELLPDKNLLSLKANTLQTIEQLRSYDQIGFTGKFVANNERQQKVDQISKIMLSSSNKVIEIRGNMGIGKTRLCYEIIKNLKLEDICIWLETPQPYLIHQIDAYLFSNEQNSLVLFNDELTGEHLNQIQLLKNKYPNRLRALVILPYRSEEPSQANETTIILDKMPDDELNLIISAYGLRPDLSKKICQICKGYPKLAVAIAEKIAKDSSSITTDDAILLLSGDFYDPGNPHTGWFRLIMDEKDRKNLGAMSVLMELGHQNIAKEELELISTYFNISINELRKTIMRSMKKGLLVDIGDYFYITPLILANQLASMTFKEYQDSISKLIEQVASMQPRTGRRTRTPIESFKNRLLSCSDDEEIKTIAASVIKGFDSNFLLAAFQNESLLEFVLGLGHIFPKVVLNLLQNTLESFTGEQFKQIEKRQSLVWFLEKAAFYEDFFHQAMDCLHILALNESDTWANNSTGVFTDFFAPYLSGSSASFEVRVKYLMHISSKFKGNKLEKEILEKCFTNALTTHRSRMTGHENAFKRPIEKTENEKAVTFTEIREVQRCLIDFFIQLENKELKKTFYEVLASHVRTILSPKKGARLWDVIEILINYNDKKILNELFRSITTILKFDSPRYPDEDIVKLTEISNRIQEGDFSTQLAIVANNNQMAFTSEEWQVQLEKSCKLVIDNPSYFNEILQLQKEDSDSNLQSYNYILGKCDLNLALWDQVKAQLAIDNQVFTNYITGYSNNVNPDKGIALVNELDSMGTNPLTLLLICSTIKGSAAKHAVFERLQHTDPQNLLRLRHSEFTRNLNSDDYNLLIKTFPYNADLMISLIANQLEKLDLDTVDLSPIIKSIGNTDKSGMEEWYVKEKFLPEAFKSKKHLPALLELFEKTLTISIDKDSKFDFSHSQFASEISHLIASKYPKKTFEIFYKTFKNPLNSPSVAAIHFRGWPATVYQESFIDIFQKESFETCYIFSKFLPNEHGVFTESAVILIKRFENEDKLESFLHSLLFTTFDAIWGSFADHYKTLIKQFEIWSKNNHLQKNKIAISLKDSLDKALARELKSEREEKYFNEGE